MLTKVWLTVLLVCVGVVIGTLVSSATEGISWLSWLSYGLDFGLTSPFVLDLKVISITFGFTLKLTGSVIIFVALSLLLGRLITRK